MYKIWSQNCKCKLLNGYEFNSTDWHVPRRELKGNETGDQIEQGEQWQRGLSGPEGVEFEINEARLMTMKIDTWPEGA